MMTLLRRIALGLLLVMLVLASVTATMIARGEGAMRQSDRAFDAGQVREAIAFARRAAVAYVPAAPHVGAAYARLGAIAKGAEAAGHFQIAREAWEGVRAAALETRHAWQPHPEELHRANENLARIMASEAPSVSGGRTRVFELLAADPSPRAPLVGLLLLGFALEISGTAIFALRALTPDGRLVPAKARLAGVLTLLGVACWTIAASQA
jgi:hypothetical protein